MAAASRRAQTRRPPQRCHAAQRGGHGPTAPSGPTRDDRDGGQGGRGEQPDDNRQVVPIEAPHLVPRSEPGKARRGEPHQRGQHVHATARLEQPPPDGSGDHEREREREEEHPAEEALPPCAARAWHGRGLVCYARSSERKEASSWRKSRYKAQHIICPPYGFCQTSIVETTG